MHSPPGSSGELPAGFSDSPMNALIDTSSTPQALAAFFPGLDERPALAMPENEKSGRAHGGFGKMSTIRRNARPYSAKCPPFFGKMSAFFRQNVRRSSAKCPPDSSQHMKFLDLSRPSKEIRIQDYSRKSDLLPKGGTDGNEARTRPESCPKNALLRVHLARARERVLRSRRPGRLRGASSRDLPGTDRRGHKRQRIGGRTACNRAGASRRIFPTA